MAEIPTTPGPQPGPQTAPGASREQLEAFLATAPEELKAWARQQLDELDAAEPAPASPAETGEAVGLEAVLDDADLEALLHDADLEAAGPAQPLARGSADEPRGGAAGVNKLLIVALVAAIVVAIYAVGNMGSGPTATEPAASMPAPTAVALDQAKVTELKDRVSKDPADIESLRELGRLYHEAGEFQEAASWQQKIVDQRPDDLDALLALGVAHFNSGDLELAEKNWLKAAAVAPDKAAPHYNLGFLYLSKTPPDYDRMEQEWRQVVALEPGSEMAQTVAAHLGRVSASPAASSSGG